MIARNIRYIFLLILMSLFLTACGEKVEVPPGHVGKIMTKAGYQDKIHGPSAFRLEPCVAFCDKLVLLDVSDKAKEEGMTIFIPEDKLNVDVGIRVTLSVNPKQTASLFGTLPPSTSDGLVASISWDQIYKTYAQQIVLTETREYLSQYSISEIASSMEKVNADLSAKIATKIADKTPFNVRYVGVTSIKYPKIITDAQENAAERRERIQQEEAQLQISKVTLERELQETRLRRQIDLEKAQIEAKSQEIQRDVVDEKVLALRRIETQRAWIEKWNGALPSTIMGDDAEFLIQMPQGK